MDDRNFVDPTTDTQAKTIFSDEDVYKAEIAQVFGRCWQFLAHDSQVENPGDFLTTYMGEDSVLVVRGQDRQVRAFLNSCNHRGNRVCLAESGNARAFTCNYHGWCYSSNGELVNVPLEREAYKSKLDKSRLGLKPIPRVETYAGFVFGCLDPAAPSLKDYLGEMAWYLDTFDAVGGLQLIGQPLKSMLDCNWKIPPENFVCDVYHVGWTHAAALQLSTGPLKAVAGNVGLPPEPIGIGISTRHGHGFGAIWDSATTLQRNPDYDAHIAAKAPTVAEKMGDWRGRLYKAHWDATIFPNCSFLYATNVFKIWIPRGPRKTEVWTWTLVEKEMPAELKRKIQKEAIRTFGTAGTLESDDGVNFFGCTATSAGPFGGTQRVNYSMGTGRDGFHPELPGVIADDNYSESAGRNFYRFWNEMMQAKDWDQVRGQTEAWRKSIRPADQWKRAS